MKYKLHKSAHSVYSIYLHIYLVTTRRRNAISMVRKEFAEEYYHWYPKSKVFWGRQKFAVSCGGAPLEIVKRYVSAHPQGEREIHPLVPQS
ncbi:MAG: hypothetical protein WBM44_07845 [Waterburya sp.]